MEHGDDIAKMAFVGMKGGRIRCLPSWEGFRTTEIEFFPSSSMKEAERWIRS